MLKGLPPAIAKRIVEGKFNNREKIVRRSPPHVFYKAMSSEIFRAFNFAEQLSRENNVVIKCYTNPAALPQKVMQFAIERNYEIYFLYRKNKEQQMHSIVTAMVKERHSFEGKQPNPWAGHVYTNLSKPSDIPPQVYEEGDMHNMCYEIGNSIHTWQALHQAYKQYGVTMCYEDTIAKGDFSLASIPDDVIKRYHSKREFLVPTKNKTSNIISNWDQIKPIMDNYIISNE